MCLIERKKYIYPDGQRETKEYYQRCYKAIGRESCPDVQVKSFDAVRIVERRPTTSSSSTQRISPLNDDIMVTTGKDGSQRVYKPITRRMSKRDSKTRSPRAFDNDYPATSSPTSPTYREIRPPTAPMPPPPIPSLSSRRPSAAPSPPSSPSSLKRTVTRSGTAIYERPPSLEMPRARVNERPSNSSRRSSFSSITAEVDDFDPLPSLPRRQSSRRVTGEQRVAPVPSTPSTSSGPTEYPTLPTHFRQDSATTLPQSDRRPPPSSMKGKTQPQGESESDRVRRLRRQQDDDNERQASIERARMADSERRQREREAAVEAQLERDRQAAEEQRRRDRLRASMDAAEAARRRADEAHREANIRATRAALEGEISDRRRQNDDRNDDDARREAARRRRLEAEHAQMARERDAAAAREQQQQQYDQPYRRSQDSIGTGTGGGPSPRTTRTTYVYPSPGGTPGTTTMMTPTTTRRPSLPSARYGPATVHNPLPLSSPTTTSPSRGRRDSSLLERGEAVLARERARVAAERMADDMERLQLEADAMYYEGGGGEVEESRADRRRERDRDREQRRRRDGYIY